MDLKKAQEISRNLDQGLRNVDQMRKSIFERIGVYAYGCKDEIFSLRFKEPVLVFSSDESYQSQLADEALKVVWRIKRGVGSADFSIECSVSEVSNQKPTLVFRGEMRKNFEVSRAAPLRYVHIVFDSVVIFIHGMHKKFPEGAASVAKPFLNLAQIEL